MSVHRLLSASVLSVVIAASAGVVTCAPGARPADPPPPAPSLATPPSATATSSVVPLVDDPAGPVERLPAGPSLEQATRPNVLLVTIDSLRADHLGVAGYPKARTPNLDRLAREGIYFARNYTNRNGTTPAHASIFTGSYPSTHGVRSHMVDFLAPDVPTIAETFAANGYVTAGLYSWLAFEPPYSGLERGFHDYLDLTVHLPSYLEDRRLGAPSPSAERLTRVLAPPGTITEEVAYSADSEEWLDGKADVTTDSAILWLEGHRADAGRRDRPFFLWVQYWDPHYPYTPTPPFDQVEHESCPGCPDGGIPTIRRIQWGEPLSPVEAEHLMQYYDGEIAFADQELGRLFAALERLELDRDTLIVVVADHGESFGELGNWLHGGDLYETDIHVPLIMRYPNGLPAGMTVEAVSQSIDVLPTILELVGLPIPPTVEGRTLLPLIHGEEDGDDRYAIAELANRLYVTIVTRDWQLLKNTASGTLRLYRASEAPHPQQDWAAAEPDVAAELRQRLEQWEAVHPWP